MKRRRGVAAFALVNERSKIIPTTVCKDRESVEHIFRVNYPSLNLKVRRVRIILEPRRRNKHGLYRRET